LKIKPDIKTSLVFICIATLVSSTFASSSSSMSLPSPLLVLNGSDKYAYGQETPPTEENVDNLICSDGLPPFPNLTCPDGLAPQASIANTTAGGLPFQPPETAPDEELSTGDNTTASDVMQMDINGDGIIDEFESQNQTAVTSSIPSSDVMQMDINGDGIIDEFESQNQTSFGAGDILDNQSTGEGVAANTEGISGGAGQLQTASIEPFTDRPYGQQMIFDQARSKDLTDAIAAVKATLSQQDKQRLDRVSFAIAKLGTGNNPVEYAGVKENDMFTAGSLLKISLLYTSFELPSRLNKLAPTVAWNWEPFYSSVMSAVPSIPDGKEKKMKVNEVVRITGTSDTGVLSFDLSQQHLSDLERIFMDQNQNDSPRTVIHRLGYAWINGALAAAGLLDLNTRKGIWYATDIGGGWSKFFADVATNGKSSSATTALAMANLLTAMHRGTLIDAASSSKMMNIMANGGSWLSVLDPSIQSTFSFVSKGAKVGIDDGSNANSGIVKSEGLFLEHDGEMFVAVWLNSPGANGADIRRDIPVIYKVIDEVVKKWP
jgi:hypothetical protein